MKAKLIKENNGYTLFVAGKIIGDTNGHPLKSITNKLSLKNCQAIERGYDLDELADEYYMEFENKIENPALFYRYFKLIFPKALEILGDKKFSEKDMSRMMLATSEWLNSEIEYGADELIKKVIQSLQQTEWEVEIKTEKVIDETKIVGAIKGVKGSGNKITTYKSVPKLDEDGCLILKKL